MTLSIPISPDLEARLRERAAASGKDLVSFVRDAVEEKLAAPQTFAEILAPVHAAFEATGLSDDEISRRFEEIRDDLWKEKHRPDEIHP